MNYKWKSKNSLLLLLCFKCSFLILLSFNLNKLQSQVLSIDTVYSFIPGIGQNIGQTPEYFPKNIFGMPSKNSNINVPESSPEQVCSLGFGGEIIVGIKDNYIINGQGYDFKIFENVFINPINKKYFVEPAIVSVSQDGINFIDFPYDYNTLEGCAGTLPTLNDTINNNLDNLGGNSFDLSDIGLEYIKYIKIKDITQLIANDPNHIYYDAVLTGFDLDAVVAKYTTIDINTSVQDDLSNAEFRNKLNIIKQNNKIIINSKLNLKDCQIFVFDILGNVVFAKTIDMNNSYYQNQLEFENLSSNQLLIINIIYKSNNFVFKVY